MLCDVANKNQLAKKRKVSVRTRNDDMANASTKRRFGECMAIFHDIKNNYQVNPIAYQNICRACCRAGKLLPAVRFFNEYEKLFKGNLPVFQYRKTHLSMLSCISRGYADHGKISECFSWGFRTLATIHEYKDKKFRDDECSVLLVLLRSCLERGYIVEGLNLFYKCLMYDTNYHCDWRILRLVVEMLCSINLCEVALELIGKCKLPLVASEHPSIQFAAAHSVVSVLESAVLLGVPGSEYEYLVDWFKGFDFEAKRRNIDETAISEVCIEEATEPSSLSKFVQHELESLDYRFDRVQCFLEAECSVVPNVQWLYVDEAKQLRIIRLDKKRSPVIQQASTPTTSFWKLSFDDFSVDDAQWMDSQSHDDDDESPVMREIEHCRMIEIAAGYGDNCIQEVLSLSADEMCSRCQPPLVSTGDYKSNKYIINDIMWNRCAVAFRKVLLNQLSDLILVFGGNASDVMVKHLLPNSLEKVCLFYPEPPLVKADPSTHWITSAVLDSIHRVLEPHGVFLMVTDQHQMAVMFSMVFQPHTAKMFECVTDRKKKAARPSDILLFVEREPSECAGKGSYFETMWKDKPLRYELTLRKK